MAAADDLRPVSFAARKPPDGFVLREVTIEVGADRAYDPGEWAGAIVVIEAGELVVECLDGDRVGFTDGAVIHLDALPLRTLRNAGPCPLRLSAMSRRRGPSPS
jgi:hypothetical protein